MIINHLVAIGLAYVIDLIVGDPKTWPHPVKWIGSFIHLLDTRLNNGNYRKLKGVLLLFIIIIVVFSVSMLLMLISYQMHFIFGIVVEAIIIATTISQKSLKEAAFDVMEPLNNRNIQAARNKLSNIVGRDTDELEEEAIVRGTVETVAENTIDGITAPLFWALIGGAPFALVYRSINTCDSMIGYKNTTYKEFGWAAARFDDVINWIPARLTAIIMMLVFQPQATSYRHAVSILLRDAKKHNSPNSGWGEGAVAALLGIQLGGVNFYQGEKSISPIIGDSFYRLESQHIVKTVVIMQRTVLLFIIVLIIGGILYELASTWF